MKRYEIPELLFEMMEKVQPYPDKVKKVEKMLETTAFFPGGKGLWMEKETEEFPNILVLGQDFSTVSVYDRMVRGEISDLNTMTWINLRKLFDEVEIDYEKCFFSNVFMGLRDTASMTGKFIGWKDKDFVNRNLDFLSRKINLIKPKVIITLGIPASDMLSQIAKQDLNCWSEGDALRIHNEGYKSEVSFGNLTCACVALEHTSMRNSNVRRRKYGNYSGHSAEVEMLKDAMSKLISNNL